MTDEQQPKTEPMYVRNLRRFAAGEDLDDPRLCVQLLLAKYDELRAALAND